jgi:hypothetical protein
MEEVTGLLQPNQEHKKQVVKDQKNNPKKEVK